MDKKGIVGDATIIAISFIIIATLGMASFAMFSLDVFKADVDQVIKEKEYNEGIDEILFDFLKQDADYKGLNNLGLVLLNTHGKIDYNIANNKINENLDVKECWFIFIIEEGRIINNFKKTGCEIDALDPEFRKTSFKVPDFEKDLYIDLGIKNE